MSVPSPPIPFDAVDELIQAGTLVYRVHSDRFRPAEFNPGFGAPTRFAFFGDPIVPILYAGDTEDAAFCETVLHDVPMTGGVVTDNEFGGRLCSRLIVRRDLRLASMVGAGPRALGVDAAAVWATDAVDYADTVLWAEAAHNAGFDGLAYPSKQAGGRRATVYFGDRVHETDFDVDPKYRWYFDDPDGFAKLYELGRSIGVKVLRFV